VIDSGCSYAGIDQGADAWLADRATPRLTQRSLSRLVDTTQARSCHFIKAIVAIRNGNFPTSQSGALDLSPPSVGRHGWCVQGILRSYMGDTQSYSCCSWSSPPNVAGVGRAPSPRKGDHSAHTFSICIRDYWASCLCRSVVQAHFATSVYKVPFCLLLALHPSTPFLF
jgi:hypothetical protein